MFTVYLGSFGEDVYYHYCFWYYYYYCYHYFYDTFITIQSSFEILGKTFHCLRVSKPLQMIYGNRLIVSQGVFVDFWFSEWQKSLIRRPIDSQLQNYQLKKNIWVWFKFYRPTHLFAPMDNWKTPGFLGPQIKGPKKINLPNQPWLSIGNINFPAPFSAGVQELAERHWIEFYGLIGGCRNLNEPMRSEEGPSSTIGNGWWFTVPFLP